MRIGQIAPPWVPVPPHGYGGTEAVIDLLSRGLKDLGHDVELFTTGDATCPVPRSWVYASPPAPMGTTMPEAHHVLAAYEALSDCDVVHDHTLVGPLAAANFPSLRVVTTNHAVFNEATTPLYRVASRHASVVAISHSQRDSVPDLPIARVIHNGIDLSAYPEGDGGDYLLFLGRIAPVKGVHVAIDIARRAGVPLLIAAKMREDLELRYFEAEVKPRLGPGVEFLGEVGPAQKIELLQGARALLNPIQWPEPFGLVMAEALACGTPVLAFPSGAAPEIVDDGETGFLRSSADELAACVPLVDELSRRACRKAVAERFSADRMVREYANFFESLA